VEELVAADISLTVEISTASRTNKSTAQTHYKQTLIQITADAADVGLLVLR
jgi:hypothetical protein